LGKGESLKSIVSSMKMVAEGVATAHSVWHLAQKLSIPMPISEQVAMVLHHGRHLEEAARGLMERPLREELDEEEMSPSS